MGKKLFSQEEINRIVTTRVKRERERLVKEFESSMKRCMASIHLLLHQEMCLLKRNLKAETKDTLLSSLLDIKSEEQHINSFFNSDIENKTTEEVKNSD